jgi:hypothetical protein
MENNNKPLKVALHGMDERSRKTLIMFLLGPCNGVAIVVDNENDAAVDIFDGDAPVSKNLLAKHLQRDVIKPVIVLSLQDFEQEGVLHVNKPVKISDMLLVLAQAKALINKLSKKPVEIAIPSVPRAVAEELQQQVNKPEKQELKTFEVDQSERNKTSKHQTAMCLDEKSFHGYIGSILDVDVNDPKQFINSYYNPKDFLQGYVQSAIAVSRAKGQILLLQSDWKPITLFPHTHEVWLDADDPQLKEFAAIKIYSNQAAKISITPVNPKAMNISGAFDKFQSMDAFLWKLACWTSKGRYSHDIDYRQPVFLKNWPNFTRLLITPHALRIAALLIQRPMTMANVAQVLNIKPQYVFVFISAAYALGLAGQAKRAADSLVQAPDIKPSNGQGLLGRILSKLRGN